MEGEARAENRRVWTERGTFMPGELVEIEVSHGEWVESRIERIASDVMCVTGGRPTESAKPRG